jgi:hypothetical protein
MTLSPDSITKGLFTNYVYKRRGIGSQKMLIYVNDHKVDNVNGAKEGFNRGVACSLLKLGTFFGLTIF